MLPDKENTEKHDLVQESNDKRRVSSTEENKKIITKNDSLKASGKLACFLLLFQFFFYFPLSLYLYSFSSEGVLTDKLEVSYH